MTPSPSQRPHILLTNDDGIKAAGLRAMAQALLPVAEVTIVAPLHEQSGMAHAITVFREMNLEEFKIDGNLHGWALDGTPADCVKVALQNLPLDRPFDAVVSGINRGQNAGVNVLYSGTVAAAREGALLGLPAIAVSLLYHDERRLPYATAAGVGVEVLQMVLDRGLPRGLLLNVNVPPVAPEEILGWRVTRMGNSGYADFYQQQDLEPGRGMRTNVGKGWLPSEPYAEDTDDHAIMNDYVSITPLQADLTAREFLPHLLRWLHPQS
jgi:5'-nucleotidase